MPAAMSPPRWVARQRLVLPLFYFVLGFVFSIISTPVKVHIRTDLGRGPAFMSVVVAYMSSPWMFKMLWGVLSDSFPIGGYRRLPYLLGCSVLSGAALVAFFRDPMAPNDTMVAYLMTASWGLVVCDVIVDSMVVETIRYERDVGSLQTRNWICRAVGSLLAHLLIFAFLRLDDGDDPFRIPPPWFFLMGGIGGLMITVLAAFLHDERIERAEPTSAAVCGRLQEVFEVLTTSDIGRPLVFIMVFALTPTSESAVWFFMTEPTSVGGLGFSMHMIAIMSCLGNLTSIVGTLLYRAIAPLVRFNTLFAGCTVVISLVSMTQTILVNRWNLAYGLGDWMFAIGDDIMADVLGQIMIMPIMIMIAKLCPPGIEGTMYASILSLMNMCNTLSDIVSATMTKRLGIARADDGRMDFTRLNTLIVVCVALNYLPLFFIDLIPERLQRLHGIKPPVDAPADA